MNYIPKKLYTPLPPHAFRKLAQITQSRNASDPREVASELLVEKIEEEASSLVELTLDAQLPEPIVIGENEQENEEQSQ